MAKKIRFPLKMANGSDVRTLEELRENFDLESVLGYYASGKLATWLSDRYYDTESEKIQSLDSSSGDLNKQICEILGVEYTDEGSKTDIESLRIRNEKIAKLKQITENQEIIEAVDSVAFDQDELFDLLDEDTEVIYLCGEKFSIPLGKGNVKYIGINNPLVILADNDFTKYKENNIVFEKVKFEESVIVDNGAGFSEPVVNDPIEEVLKSTGCPDHIYETVYNDVKETLLNNDKNKIITTIVKSECGLDKDNNMYVVGFSYNGEEGACEFYWHEI